MTTSTCRFLIDETDLTQAIGGIMEHFPGCEVTVRNIDNGKALFEIAPALDSRSVLPIHFEAKIEALLSSLSIGYVVRSGEIYPGVTRFKVTHASNTSGIFFFVENLEQLKLEYFWPNRLFPGANFEDLTIERL